MAGRMEGKVAIVTGGARGMGAAHAQLLAEEGAKVVVADVLDELGAEVADTLTGRGLAAIYVHLDVSSAADWTNVVHVAQEKFGTVTVLVNNAGITGSMAAVDDETEEGWDRCIAVNQKGVWLGMREVVPGMREAGGGSIVNICSIWGLVGAENFIAYHASKGAVQIMTKNAAVTLARTGIRVNNICPGLIETPMMEEEGDENNAAVIRLTPMGRTAKPREVSYGVLYLASDESSYVTGTELIIDGGYTAQ